MLKRPTYTVYHRCEPTVAIQESKQRDTIKLTQAVPLLETISSSWSTLLVRGFSSRVTMAKLRPDQPTPSEDCSLRVQAQSVY